MLTITIILMQSLAFWCIFYGIDCFRDTSKKYKTAANILYGICMLLAGVILISIFGSLTIIDTPTGENLPKWIIVVSIILTSYLYYYFPKTKIWKKRQKAKQTLEFAFNTILGMIGLGIIVVGVSHILYSAFVWLKEGVWKSISLGYWFNLDRLDTGFKGVDKILDYTILDISAFFPLVVLGLVIFLASQED